MNIGSVLQNCILFRGYPINEIETILSPERYRMNQYGREQVIALEGDVCEQIGIVISGTAEVRKIFSSGKTVTIERLQKGDIFGEVIIYSEMRRYPSTIVSVEPSSILFLSRREVTRLCSENSRIMENFMGLLSNKILMLNRKVKNLSYHSLRRKVCSLFLEEYHKQKSLTLRLPYSRREMADQLGIPRPSLSREMIRMKEEGLIDFQEDTVKLLNPEALEEELQ